MSLHLRRRKISFAVALMITFFALAPQAAAHETDQFTLPPGREFADFGDHLTRFAYDAIVKGVERQNNRIQTAVEGKAIEDEIKTLQSGEELAYSVNRQFPVALFLIEDLDKLTTSNEIKPLYPGRIVGYKPQVGIRKNIDISINPFRAWGCATIYAYGVYLGTDKIGHFTDMGMHYYRGYVKARAEGKSEEEAAREGLQIGTHGPIYSERGMLGLNTAGAYSNADLVANYMGMCFYRNLSEPVMLKGTLRPPMVVREGHLWRIAPQVRPDSDFFSLFISEHLNEALNPSLYRDEYRPKMRDAIREHRHETLARFTDRNGNVLPREFFQRKLEELSTYWGFDYGHEGNADDLITIADTCFAPPPDLNNPSARNDDGLTAVHWAAQEGDLETLRKLLEAGGDANMRVPAGKSIPVVAGDTPLHLAAARGHLDAVKMLIERGADVSARNVRGVTPLHRAVAHPQVAEVLLDAAAVVDAADHVGRTPLHWAANDPDLAASMKVLLDHAARPMLLDRDGLTPLHLAAQNAASEAVVALLKAGADVNAPDRFAITPLHLAAELGGTTVTELLLRAGAQANQQDKFGVTPLLIATRAGQEQTIRTLLARGADPGVSDAYGVSPLALAGRSGSARIVQLFEQSAGVNAAVTAGQTIAPGQ